MKYFILLLALSTGCNTKKSESISDLKNTKIADLLSYNENRFPSYNSNYPPPTNANEIFELSQDYPIELPKENLPWQRIDFIKSPYAYMDVILKYCLEGNTEVNFKGQNNKTRKWYHAPWLHDDGRFSTTGEYIGNGREYIHGLTRELASPKFKIHKNQDVELENWAVGMYNSIGGYTLGKVWNSPTENPIPRNANFPEGTVSFKLLFTDGDINKVPFLENTLEWTANIYSCNPRNESCGNKRRSNRIVRLLQVDIAVKDRRATKTGWVFGTFVYDASKNGKTVWERLEPVGLSWGDDPTVTIDLNRDGVFINSELKESILNESLINFDKNESNKKAYVLYHGLGGRLNGPVDNLISSCVSCHGQAGVSSDGTPLPLGNFDRSVNRLNYPLTSFNQFFTNVSPGSITRIFNGKDYSTTDYSLQLSAGIRNYYNNLLLSKQVLTESMKKNKKLESFTKEDVKNISNYINTLPEVTRGEN